MNIIVNQHSKSNTQTQTHSTRLAKHILIEITVVSLGATGRRSHGAVPAVGPAPRRPPRSVGREVEAHAARVGHRCGSLRHQPLYCGSASISVHLSTSRFPLVIVFRVFSTTIVQISGIKVTQIRLCTPGG